MRFQALHPAVGLFAAIGVMTTATHAEGVRAFSTEAPTSAQSSLDLEGIEEPATSLERSAGADLSDLGGYGKLRTLSIRGSRARDTGVFLEGIRLNSPASGDFDLSQIAPFGLGQARIIRGPQTSLSTHASGRLLLSLPAEPIYKSSLLAGSYGYLGATQLTPNSSLSYEQAQNDFEYYENGVRQTRTHNFVRRVNGRAWYQKKNYQVWGQVLFLDQDLPGATTWPTPQAESQTISSTLAIQGGRANLNTDFWIQQQSIYYSDASAPLSTTNHILSTGSRIKFRNALTQNIGLHTQIELLQDKLFSSSNASPLRWIPSWTMRLPLYVDSLLIQPQLRLEYVSDMREPLSAHPSLGLKYQLNQALSIFGNLAYVSRAPTFNEMYFESPPSLANPDLKRQASFLTDLGMKWRRQALLLQQTFFLERASDYLQSIQLAGGGFQVQNQGRLLSLGTETEIAWEVKKWAQLQLNYSYLRARIAGEPLAFRPEHQWTLAPEFFGNTKARLRLPLSLHTRTRSTDGSKLPWQMDLSLNLTARWQDFEFDLNISNLLSSEQIQTPGYPLAHGPSVRSRLSYRW